MRSGSTSICCAFLDGKAKRLKNDEASYYAATPKSGLRLIVLTYHGNVIAERADHNGPVKFSLAGYNTMTTRLRINQLLSMLDADFRICCIDHEPYAFSLKLNDEKGNRLHVPISARDWYPATCWGDIARIAWGFTGEGEKLAA